MKKIFVLILFAAFLTACGGAQKEEAAQRADSTSTVKVDSAALKSDSVAMAVDTTKTEKPVEKKK